MVNADEIRRGGARPRNLQRQEPFRHCAGARQRSRPRLPQPRGGRSGGDQPADFASRWRTSRPGVAAPHVVGTAPTTAAGREVSTNHRAARLSAISRNSHRPTEVKKVEGRVAHAAARQFDERNIQSGNRSLFGNEQHRALAASSAGARQSRRAKASRRSAASRPQGAPAHDSLQRARAPLLSAPATPP